GASYGHLSCGFPYLLDCAFVLPLKDLGCIRPSVFKPASQLASGQKISLTIPVLACIYKGLGELASSFTLGKQVEHFPAHYVYAWDINWVIIAPNDTTSVKYVDNSMQSQQVIDFLLSVRSCFLTLRYENNCIAEPYSPHRFSRQFGFYQDIPGKLKPPPEKVTRQYLYSLFQTSVQLGTYSSFVIPARGLKMNLRVTDSYTSCPKEPAMRGTKGDRSRSPSRSSKDGKSSKDKDRTVLQDIFDGTDSCGETLSDEEQKANFDIAAELNACNNSFGAIDEDLLAAASDPIVLYAASTIIARNSEVVHDAPPIQTAAPSFKAQDMISEADRYAVGFLVKQMKTRLLHTPLNNIPVLDPELKELLGYIASNSIDVTSLREHVEAYVSHARSFHALDSKEEEQIKSQQAEILKIEQRCDELQKELKLLEQKKSELSSTLATSEDSLAKHDETVKGLTISHTSLEKTSSQLRSQQQGAKKLKKISRMRVLR
ncbi:EH domain-containing and endocytosis protein 1, partial [Bienertia sinuspersici]